MLEKMRGFTRPGPPPLPSSLARGSDSAVTVEGDPLVTSPALGQRVAVETEELRKKGGSPGGGGGRELRPRQSEGREEPSLPFCL